MVYALANLNKYRLKEKKDNGGWLKLGGNKVLGNNMGEEVRILRHSEALGTAWGH